MLKPNFNHFFRHFYQIESASAGILLIATLLALVLANSPFAQIYFNSLHTAYHGLTLYHSVNEGLMTLFFLLVSLEIKRELITGELNSPTKASLPIIAALGGMILPAGIYLFINHNNTETLAGWAIPCATDIAFSLAILNTLGARIPLALRVFLTALAIIDDLGSILIIAIFYTYHIHILFLFLALIVTICLASLNICNYKNNWLYLLLGTALWFFILKSGVHATVAGVILAFTIPLSLPKSTVSPLKKLEKHLHTWVAFLILPLFALSNAGLSWQTINLGQIFNPLPLGITLGLFLGKQLGIFSCAWIAIKLHLVALPQTVNWQQMYGVSILCGIGFTMSLFIGTLAFPNNPTLFELVKLGVFLGSFLSAMIGYLFLLRTNRTPSL